MSKRLLIALHENAIFFLSFIFLGLFRKGQAAHVHRQDAIEY